MYEIISIEDWEKTIQISDFLLLITKDSCEDCIDVERYLEKNSYLIDKLIVKKINLNNPESTKLIKSLKWINIEVDFVPFWSLYMKSERKKTIIGNIEQVKKIL